ncbi:alpha/beta hydrolase, partial [candidate division FCPU426 bacterium]|nr:alpha/beta hydrolase [candidate division FCPU426 bacterium]
VPVFFLHGREDEIIPCSHTEKLYARALQPKKKMIFHGDHNTLDFILTDDYAQTMKRLVVKGLL